MDQATQDLITERTRALPQVVKDALAHIDMPKELMAVAEKAGLRIDQAGVLETEILLAILGIEPMASFSANIARELNVSKEKAEEITSIVNERVFRTLRVEMIETEKKSRETPSNEETPPTPTPQTNIAQDKLTAPQRSSQETVTIKKNLYGATPDPYREPVE